VLGVLFHISAFAYPEFIGFGYASCLTCHFNGQGNGSLGDYGRALWSGEIASRSFYSASRTDEQIAESSGFLGKKELPWWIRPAVKYRGLWNKTNYGSGTSVEKTYNMQADFNFVVKADQDEKYILYFTEGFRPNANIDPSKYLNRWLAREYWIRVKFGETHWLYAGLMEKVFGLRNIDHTSYTRAFQKLRQYDQSLGVIYHKIEPTWEISGNVFSGNPDEATEEMQKGGSLMFDKEIGENKRFSISYLSSKSEVDSYELTALSYRGALTKGSSVLGEYGLRRYGLISSNTFQSGSWTAIHSFIQLTRGYNFHSSLERYNEEFKPSASDKWRWAIGMIMFPAPRIEFRTDLVTKREIIENGANEDNWTLQGQLHVSL
jgi:hypothetical protein